MIVSCTINALKIRSLPILDDSTDLGKRFVLNQTANVYGKSLDNLWFYVDAPAARGWVASQYVKEESNIVITSPAWPRVPNGITEIKSLFGEPGKPICQAGRVKLPKELKISWGNDKIVVFACHKLIEDVFTSVFVTINNQGLWELIEDFGGCYNYRNIRGATHISTHAWGIGLDINTKSNPLGSHPKMPVKIIRIFEDHGFVWGGNWNRPDGMHFQYAKGY